MTALTILTIPTWLKVPHPKQPIAYYQPEALLFIPQRRVVARNGYPNLLDACDRPYPLHLCEEPRLEHLNTCPLFISDTGYSFTVLRRGEGVYANSDGVRQVYWRVVKDEALEAAQALATMFNGAIYTEVQ